MEEPGLSHCPEAVSVVYPTAQTASLPSPGEDTRKRNDPSIFPDQRSQPDPHVERKFPSGLSNSFCPFGNCALKPLPVLQAKRPDESILPIPIEVDCSLCTASFFLVVTFL